MRAARLGLSTLHECHARDVMFTNAVTLAGQTGYACHVSFYESDEVTYTDVVEVLGERVRASLANAKIPAACSAPGKAFLAELDDDEVARIASKGLPKFASQTKTSEEEIREDIRLTRERGYGYAESEWIVSADLWPEPVERGLAGVAMVVFDRDGRPAGALGVSTPVPKPTAFPDDVIEPLREATLVASMELGYRSPFRRSCGARILRPRPVSRFGWSFGAPHPDLA